METIEQFTIFCTSEQTQKFLELGAPIRYKDTLDNRERGKFEIPTAEQMVGFIESQGIFVDIDCNNDGYEYALWKDDVSFHHRIKYRLNLIENIREFETRKEATLAAISSALEYLKNKK